MYKMEHYLGIDPKHYKISIKGAADLICDIRNEITEWINESLKTEKAIIGKITIEYGNEEYWDFKKREGLKFCQDPKKEVILPLSTPRKK